MAKWTTTCPSVRPTARCTSSNCVVVLCWDLAAAYWYCRYYSVSTARSIVSYCFETSLLIGEYLFWIPFVRRSTLLGWVRCPRGLRILCYDWIQTANRNPKNLRRSMTRPTHIQRYLHILISGLVYLLIKVVHTRSLRSCHAAKQNSVSTSSVIIF